MFFQIAVGSGLLLLSVLVGAFSAWLMEMLFARAHSWLMRAPHRPKLMLVIATVSLWALAIVTVAVWIWAFAFLALGALPDLETSVYFALSAFTTLGHGDVLLPKEWRLLGGIAAANGFLNFGLLTAFLVEALRHIRLGQVEQRYKKPEADG